ncbi:hypothetical protein JQN72_16780 [Phycicoccus sp. CSK15P-2]|uniref:hypothetical protein n=1 Tax=Phycicoccus sp. CSK15P-2 TaxID=2807627 RepID=UPI001950AF1F|nr:hypothetical protein [Phycicoccus sp. CSK15P-2]MBM6405899.1 hypothetical protein [Phycicoccus sp. CSK15P-2]
MRPTSDRHTMGDTIRGAQRLRAAIEHVERAATYDPDPTLRASAVEWLDSLLESASGSPVPPAMTPWSPEHAVAG